MGVSKNNLLDPDFRPLRQAVDQRPGHTKAEIIKGVENRLNVKLLSSKVIEDGTCYEMVFVSQEPIDRVRISSLTSDIGLGFQQEFHITKEGEPTEFIMFFKQQENAN
jgi:hypothetical protein